MSARGMQRRGTHVRVRRTAATCARSGLIERTLLSGVCDHARDDRDRQTLGCEHRGQAEDAAV